MQSPPSDLPSNGSPDDLSVQPIPSFEQLFLFPCFPYSSLITHFLNSATNSQSDWTVKEAPPMQNSFSTQAIADSSAATYRAVNQSPECMPLPEPIVGLNREPAPVTDSFAAVTAVSLESMQAVMRQLADVKAELNAMKQSQSRQAQITQAQNKQLERRLQHFVQNLVKSAMHDAIQRFARPRSSAVPEPARQPSTYIVPQR